MEIVNSTSRVLIWYFIDCGFSFRRRKIKCALKKNYAEEYVLWNGGRHEQNYEMVGAMRKLEEEAEAQELMSGWISGFNFDLY